MGCGPSKINYDFQAHNESGKVRELIQKLSIPEDVINELWTAYQTINMKYFDPPYSTAIDIDAILLFFDLPRVPLTIQIFKMFDSKKKNQFVTFEEFVFGVWNFCSYQAEREFIGHFLWDTFDFTYSNSLTGEEIFFLLTAFMYGRSVPSIIIQSLHNRVNFEADRIYDIQDFFLVIAKDVSLLIPLMQAQSLIRRQTGGEIMWKKIAKKRSFDTGSTTCWEMVDIDDVEHIYSFLLGLRGDLTALFPVTLDKKLANYRDALQDNIKRDLEAKKRKADSKRIADRAAAAKAKTTGSKKTVSKTKQMMAEARLASSNIVRRLSVTLNFSIPDPTQRLTEEQQQVEYERVNKIKSMKRKSSIFRQRGIAGQMDQGNKNKPSVYTRVRRMSNHLIEGVTGKSKKKSQIAVAASDQMVEASIGTGISNPN